VTRSGLRSSPDGPQTGSADHGGMPPSRNSASGPIVVGVERSERSRDAVALGRTLARSLGRELLLVAVYLVDTRSALMSPVAHAAALADEADATLEWAALPFGGPLAQTRAVPSTSVARGLQAVAEDEDALAIVVGPSHRGSLGHVVPGSVGERLLRSAPCPVAVAPSGYRSAGPGPIHRIGVGFTAEPEADEALAAAVGIGARTGATIHVLSVVEPPSAVVLGFAWGYGELEQTARDNLAGSLAGTMTGAAARVEIDGEVIDGYADDELARFSTEVDLLICGSRRLGRLGRVMLGSVSAGVMRKARCPVLIVPRGAPDGFAQLRAAPEGSQCPRLAVAASPQPGRSS
jgi:nucleotide-binding universal stress UspA family protein